MTDEPINISRKIAKAIVESVEIATSITPILVIAWFTALIVVNLIRIIASKAPQEASSPWQPTQLRIQKFGTTIFLLILACGFNHAIFTLTHGNWNPHTHLEWWVCLIIIIGFWKVKNLAERRISKKD